MIWDLGGSGRETVRLQVVEVAASGTYVKRIIFVWILSDRRSSTSGDLATPVTMTKADEASTSKKGKEVAMETIYQASTRKQETKDLEMGLVSESHGHGDNTDKKEDAWVNYIKEKLEKYNSSRDAGTEISRIPRVPVEFFRHTNEAYKPCIISIGPYHRGNSETKHMEQCKWQCLKDVLDRKEGSHLKVCFKVLESLEGPAKRSYDDDFHLESWDFMEMMLLDGCFIVDYLRDPLRYIPDTKPWMKRQIDNDLLLFENQLPFIVLEEIFDFFKMENESERLKDLTLSFCKRVGATNIGATNTILTPSMLSGTKFQHLLDFYHAYLFFNKRRKRENSSQSTPSDQIRTIHSASVLGNQAGIQFKRLELRDKVIGTRFNPDGVMNITPLVIDAFTRSQFQNLIAFEKCNPSIEPGFTSFAKFMDYIIDTATDVRLLRENGIIERTLGSDEEVAAIFNQLNTATFDDYIPPDLAKTYERADEYYKNQGNKWMAILKQKHINSPWAVISIIAGVLILLFTFTQTLLAILSYSKPAS